MTRWVPFLGLVTVVLAVVLFLARQSSALLRAPSDGEAVAAPRSPADATAEQHLGEPTDSAPVDRSFPGPGGALSSSALLANVAVTQGLVAGVVVVGLVVFEVPLAAIGLAPDPWITGAPAVVVGLVLGAALWLLSEAAGLLADAAGFGYDERLRALLAPASTGGWVVLFAVVLPVIALAEELLFRAALIGVPAAGLDLSAWPLVAGSSVAFALGHGAQGRVGVVATGALGLVLASAFVVTESLLVVVLAHYVVNVLEFGVHEGLGIELA